MADAELKYEPVSHAHEAFLAKALKRKGFKEKYDELGDEYALAKQMNRARTKVRSHAGSGGAVDGHNQKRGFPS